MEKFTILGKDLAYHGKIIDFYKLSLCSNIPPDR